VDRCPRIDRLTPAEVSQSRVTDPATGAPQTRGSLVPMDPPEPALVTQGAAGSSPARPTTRVSSLGPLDSRAAPFRWGLCAVTVIALPVDQRVGFTDS